MSVNADQTFSGDSIFENIYVHGKLVSPEVAISIFRKILSKEGYAAQMLGPNWENNDNTVEVHEYQLPESKALRKLSIKRST